MVSNSAATIIRIADLEFGYPQDLLPRCCYSDPVSYRLGGSDSEGDDPVQLEGRPVIELASIARCILGVGDVHCP